MNHLTNPDAVGTMKEGGEDQGSEPSKYKRGKRARGPAADRLKDFLLRLHTFARDQREWLTDPETSESAYEALIIIMADLADMTKAMHDNG